MIAYSVEVGDEINGLKVVSYESYDDMENFTRVKRKAPVFQAGDISEGARFI